MAGYGIDSDVIPQFTSALFCPGCVSSPGDAERMGVKAGSIKKFPYDHSPNAFIVASF